MFAAAAVAAAASLVACQSLDAPSGGTETQPAGDTLTVGFITPLTGGLAAFGEPDEWVTQYAQAWFDEHPIEGPDGPISIEIIVEDSQSSPDTAGQAAQRLIADGADVLLAHATPETTVPVSLACIDAGIPCITADTPLEPWALSVVGPKVGADNPPALAEADDIQWVHHFFWGLGEVVGTYISMWDQTDTNKKVAGLFPNDPDGQAWSGALPQIFDATGSGYVLDNPGLYEPGTTDFTSLINTFKANGDEIVTGVIPPPDFAAFWQQAQQLGYHPKVVSVAKATEFPAAIASFENPAGLSIEQWWTPGLPASSSLTGISAADLAAEYTAATGKQWNVVLGFSEALFEVLAAAVAEGGTDGAAIDAAVGALKLDTIVGPLDFPNGPYPNTAVTYPVGAQWRADPTGEFEFVPVVISDPFDTGTPVESSLEPIAY
jgi:branched-chain amino acid transport system substrate-binding protein